MSKSYAKILTKNDVGETGGHQAGITVPKADLELISFFPFLNPEEFNPDSWLYCTDADSEVWKMRYIYYNGKSFEPPKNTRNEYRITHMTKFFSKWGAKTGDHIVLTKGSKENAFQISINGEDKHSGEMRISENSGPIILRGWSRVY